MTTKDLVIVSNPWEIWPDGTIPAEGNRREWKLRSREEGKTWLRELAETRAKCMLPDGITAIDVIRQERDGA